MSTAHPRYGQVDRDYGIRLATTPPDDDGPIWMVNLMQYREVADYGEAGGEGVSGREADDRYAPVDVLRDIGAEVVFVADVDSTLLGDGGWDRIGVVRYPSRRAFIEMQSRDDFRSKHVHKDAGMARTIVMGCLPAPSPADGLDPSTLPDWDDVPHPPTDDDGPVVVLHVLRFADGDGRRQMAEYQQRAALAAVPHGVRIAGWFDVEGTIVGDGRPWDQVRFNAFPSKAAFLAVAADPDRLSAHHDHRQPALADTYALVLRPTTDRLAASTG